MLWQRIITALILLAIIIPATISKNPIYFNIIIIIFIIAASWEWGKLNPKIPNNIKSKNKQGIISLIICITICTAIYINPPSQNIIHKIWIIASIIWPPIIIYLLAKGIPHWQKIPHIIRTTIGLITILITGLAIIQAKNISTNFLFSVLSLVWAADIFAYIAGRLIGGKIFKNKKLAPQISPKKSIEGAIGGAIGVITLSFAWIIFDKQAQITTHAEQSIYTHLYTHGVIALIIAVITLTIISITGDLIESLVKRSAGEKDSSQLLPGHGGVLDRIDALIPTLPIAMLMHTIS